MRTEDIPLASSEVDRQHVRLVYGRVRAWYHRHVHQRWMRALLLPIREAVHRYLRWLEYRAEVRHERRLHLQTAGIRRVKVDRSSNHDATYYEATPFGVLEPLLDALALTPEDVFVDIGCGKGRVVCLVAMRSLRKVIGIDMVPAFLEEARRNVARVDPPTPIEIIEGDATTLDLYEGTIYYLFNPFGASTMAAVLANIRESLVRHPRQIRIVYTTPLLAPMFDAQEWLEADGELCGMVRIWKSRLPANSQSEDEVRAWPDREIRG